MTTIVSSVGLQEERTGVWLTRIVLSANIPVSADMPESRAEARVP